MRLEGHDVLDAMSQVPFGREHQLANSFHGYSLDGTPRPQPTKAVAEDARILRNVGLLVDGMIFPKVPPGSRLRYCPFQ